MDEKQWESTLNGTPLVHIMYTWLTKSIHCDGTCEHREHIQLALMCASVLPFLPSASDLPDVGKQYTIVPLGYIDLVQQAGILELMLEQHELII
jgi:hypothetical protein